MAFAPYEFLWIVKESAYGTPKASPTAGVDSMYIRVVGANRFTMRRRLTKRKIKFGGGFAAPGYVVSDQEANVGQLQVELCYTQAKLLMDWAATRVNVAQTVPWTTTEPAGDLASCSVYHGTTQEDTGAIVRKLYSGTKVTSWKVEASAETGVMMLTLQLRAQRTAASDPSSGTFAAPADTAFPTDPILFAQGASGISVGGSTLAYCQAASHSGENALDNRYFQSAFLTFDRLRGRTLKSDLQVLKTATPDWRARFLGLTSLAVTSTFTNTTNTFALDFKAQTFVDGLEDDQAEGKVFDQNVTLETQWDPSASADVAFTLT